MLIKGLNRIKRGLQRSALRPALERLGVIGLGRRLYNSMLLKKGTHEATVLGQRLRFAVSSPIEIVQIDGLFNEDEFLSRLLDSLRPGDVFYDIGANIGLVSLLAAGRARTMGAAVTIHAFEPEPRNFDRCRENLSLNGAGRVHVHRYGLGSAAGRVRLYMGSDGEVGAGQHTIVPQNAGTDRAIDIDLRTTDETAREIEPPTIAKIDVEGAEAEVLLGMQGLIASGKPRDLFIEVHLKRIFTPGFDEHRLRAWLEERGYRLVWSQEHATSWHQHYTRAD